MHIHLLSDLHLEFASFQPRVRNADLTILAGDIHTRGRGVAWALAAFPGRVLIVPGNHEFYGGHLQRTLAKMRSVANGRVMVLDRDSVVIDGVRFLGATAWTDLLSSGDFPEACAVAEQHMSDYVAIRCTHEGRDYVRPTPAILATEAMLTRQWLETELAIAHDGPTVVITHHAPSLRSLPQEAAGDALGASYANSWDHLFGDAVALWLHGHTHHPADYVANGTRVVCNPRGYPDAVPQGFRPDLLLEIA